MRSAKFPFAFILIKRKRSFSAPCDSVGIRTRDPQLRRLLLYPAELRNHRLKKIIPFQLAGAKVVIFFKTSKF